MLRYQLGCAVLPPALAAAHCLQVDKNPAPKSREVPAKKPRSIEVANAKRNRVPPAHQGEEAHTGAKTQHIESSAAFSRLSTQNSCRSNRQKLIAWKTQAPRASKLKHRNNTFPFSSAASAAPPPCQIEAGRLLRFRCDEHGRLRY
jgi:hypothetical protein